MKNVSVCIASYNGQSFIKDQVESILLQLGINDEIIIVDDVSEDSTLSILNSLSDERVKVFKNDVNVGHVETFERAITIAQGDIIFLSDQDDIWVPGRLDAMVSELNNSGKSVIATNFYVFETNIDFARKNRKQLPNKYSLLDTSLRIFIGKIPYFGCAMAFKRSIRNILLPFPSCVESHDLWLAWVGVLNGGIAHSNSESLYHRIHQSNLTPRKKRGWVKIARTRIYFFLMIVFILSRKMK